MNFNEIIELLKEKQGLRTLADVAEYLGMSRNGVIAMKSGRGALKDRTIERIMEGTGLEAVEIVAAWKAEHGRSKKVRESFQRWMKGAAAVVILTIGAGLYPVDSTKVYAEEGLNNLCIMRNIRRRWIKVRSRLCRILNQMQCRRCMAWRASTI